MDFYDKKMSKLWYEYRSINRDICKMPIKNLQYHKMVTKRLELYESIMDYISSKQSIDSPYNYSEYRMKKANNNNEIVKEELLNSFKKIDN